MTLTEKVAYLKGLAAGLDLDKESKEAKIFDAMFEILEDMALTVTDIDEDLSSVEELVDAIDEDLDELEEYSKKNDIPIFVLETGGTPLEEFKFPKKGICIIGSEELGVSPEALKKASYGRVTIPMKGLKASLNVGVAFGILMQKWVESLQK